MILSAYQRAQEVLVEYKRVRGEEARNEHWTTYALLSAEQKEQIAQTRLAVQTRLAQLEQQARALGYAIVPHRGAPSWKVSAYKLQRLA